MPAFISMIVTPVVVSPARIAACTGEAPRQRGSSDGWTFSTPLGASASTSGRRIWPYATVTSASGLSAAIAVTASGSRRDSGWSTRRPRPRAAALTGDGVTRCPRPAGVRLRHHGGDVVTVGGEALEGRHGELRGADEDDTHAIAVLLEGYACQRVWSRAILARDDSTGDPPLVVV